MTVRNVLGFVRRWLPLLLLGPLLGGLAGYLLLREVPSVYEARVTLLVSQGSVTTTTGAEELRGAEQLARTYAEVVKTRGVLEEAAARVGLTVPFRELQQRVNARLVRDTQLLRISAEDTDPARAAQLANAVADVFIAKNVEAQAGRFASSRDNLARLVDSLRADVEARTRQIEELRVQPPSPARDAELARLQSELTGVQNSYSNTLRSYEELRVGEARGTTTLTVVEPAVVPDESVRPRRLQTIALAALAGLLAATALAALAHYLDDGLRGAERVTNATGLPILGSIPRSDRGRNPSDIAARRRAEGYRLLLLNLQVATSDQQLRTLMIASGGIAEGKSVTAQNLALALADSGQRVILVDADLHRPTQSKLFNLPNRTGLSRLLLNPSEPVTAALQQTSIENLEVLTAGQAQAWDAWALFSSKRLQDRLEELASLCDVVVFDTPPLLAQPDAALLASHVDGVLYLVDVTKSRGRTATQAIDVLRKSGARVIGAVLNRVPEKALQYAAYYTDDYPEDRVRSGANGEAQTSSPSVASLRKPG